MLKPLLLSNRHFASGAATLCMLSAVLLAGCASKNPLMEEPAPVAARESRPAPEQPAAGVPPAQAAATPPAQQQQQSSAQAAPATATAPAANTGVQTTRQSRLFSFLSPYRIDIQQGNFVSREMVAQLKPGLTPDQVRFLLGTPLLTDIFHANRWDYPFRLQKGNGEVTTSRVTLFFKDDRLDRFEGGDLPTEKDYLARLAGSEPPKSTGSAPAALPGAEVPPAQPAPATARDPSNR